MDAFREALAVSQEQYRIPSLEEVLNRIRGFKREFPKVDGRFYDFIEKDMTKIYNRNRRRVIGFSVYQGLLVLGAPLILEEVKDFKNFIENEIIGIRKVLEELNKVPLLQDQYKVYNAKWANQHETDNTNQSKFTREEEVEEPLIRPVPKEMGTTNPLAKIDDRETINPLSKKKG